MSTIAGAGARADDALAVVNNEIEVDDADGFTTIKQIIVMVRLKGV